MKKHPTRMLIAASITALVLAFMTGCSGEKPTTGAPTGTTTAGAGGGAPSGGGLTGSIVVDGSSTVYPITEAVAEEFQKTHPGVKVTVNQSGTGGGFKKFANKETDISNASRPIKTSEEEALKNNGLEYIEIPVAYDGLSIVVNKENNWADSLTVAELRAIWDKGSKINNWKQVRPGFPDLPLKLYGAGTDSGTFDYFTDAINGEERRSRSDYQASEDDNVLVQGVMGDKGALGYFGYAYYEENRDKIKLVAVDNGKGPVVPSQETINNGTYQPLSRPLFIYVRKDVAERPEVQAFVKFYLTEVKKLLPSVGYVPLPDAAYELGLKRFEGRVTGSVFSGGSQVGVKIEDLLKKEAGQ